MKINTLKNKKIFTVITVTLNSDKTIKRTIKSVLRNYEYIKEYIVIDGLSKDNTLKILNSYRSQFLKKKINFYLSSKKDNGIYDAMNRGIKKSTGKIISILNSDDWYENNVFTLVLKYFQKNSKIQIIHGNLIIHKNNKKKKIYPKFGLNYFFWFGMTIFHPTFFVKADVYKKIIYEPNFKIAGDYNFLLQTISKKINYFYLNKFLVNFQHGGASTNFVLKGIKEIHKIKINAGYNFFLIWLSTLYYGLLTILASLRP